MQKVYIATVQVAVKADSPGEAADGLSAILTELMPPDPDFMLDWTYLKVGGQYLYPVESYVPNEDEYEEGDFLTR